MNVLMGFTSEIMHDNILHFNKFKCVPPNASYIAGFIDGDGCIFIRKISDGFQTGIQISQSRINILLILQHHFGGTIRQSHTNRTNASDTLRNQYNLNIRSNEYKLILSYIYHHIIIKTCQIKALKEISNYVNKTKFNDKKEKCYFACSTANKNKTFDCQHLVKMNDEYISGLFDAEGCLYISKNKMGSHFISISQKSHPEVLESIKQYLGFGNVYKSTYVINSKESCLKFIKIVEHNLIVKYNQCQYYKQYLLTTDKLIKCEMYNKCNYEKHANEEFNYDMYDGLLNKNMYNSHTIFNDMRNKCLYKISHDDLLQKLTINNSSNQHLHIAKKIKKNKLSEEILICVRERINEGKQNIDIENEFQLKRHVVSRIKNNVMVLKNETKRPNIKKTQEQQNIERRKISIQTILKIIDKLIENKLPSVILNEVLEEDMNSKLTIDIVKNIKRKIKDNVVPFYDFEVPKNVYERYVELIK